MEIKIDKQSTKQSALTEYVKLYKDIKTVYGAVLFFLQNITIEQKYLTESLPLNLSSSVLTNLISHHLTKANLLATPSSKEKDLELDVVYEIITQESKVLNLLLIVFKELSSLSFSKNKKNLTINYETATLESNTSFVKALELFILIKQTYLELKNQYHEDLHSWLNYQKYQEKGFLVQLFSPKIEKAQEPEEVKKPDITSILRQAFEGSEQSWKEIIVIPNKAKLKISKENKELAEIIGNELRSIDTEQIDYAEFIKVLKTITSGADLIYLVEANKEVLKKIYKADSLKQLTKLIIKDKTEFKLNPTYIINLITRLLQ